MHAYLFSLSEYTWMHVYVYLETTIMGARTISYHQMSGNVKSLFIYSAPNIFSYLVFLSFMMDDDNSLQQKIIKKAFEGIQKISAKFFSRTNFFTSNFF